MLFLHTAALLVAFLSVSNAYLSLSNDVQRRHHDLMESVLRSHNGSLRGVNIGGWFIPEYWMVDFYTGTNLTDMCSFGAYDRNDADERMFAHLDTWISEDDFAWLAEQNVNTVRLPLGYWNIIDDPYEIYFPVDVSTSMFYIDKLFYWTEKYGMSVILDLHGAPGSQNGNDHSGCGNGVVGWNTETNRNLTLTTISTLAQRYGHKRNLLAIELMNEPAYSLEQDSHADLVSYYEAAYQEIRKYTSVALVAFNVLYSDFYDTWDSELSLKSGYYGVITDWHLYDCFGDSSTFTTEQHIADAVRYMMICVDIIFHFLSYLSL